jgi:hypothetical protein
MPGIHKVVAVLLISRALSGLCFGRRLTTEGLRGDRFPMGLRDDCRSFFGKGGIWSGMQ